MQLDSALETARQDKDTNIANTNWFEQPKCGRRSG